MPTCTIVVDIRQNMSKTYEDTDSKTRVVNGTRISHHRLTILTATRTRSRMVASTTDGPNVLCLQPVHLVTSTTKGCDELIGGRRFRAQFATIDSIGKSSISPGLHDNRVKQRCGGSRWSIRYDGFPASNTYFLCCPSNAISAGIKPP